MPRGASNPGGESVSDDELTIAIIEALAAAGVGVWRPAGPIFTAAETGIFYGPLDPTPDRAVGVTVYAADETLTDPRDGVQWRRVQIRVRGATGVRNSADVLASQVKAAMDALSRERGINHIRRVLVAPLGADGNGRTERADSYSVTLED